ncbi:hypothetical protein KEM55_005187 [Ascosphaera atra]|nr:hypothetical protein KEM55_005187 [Ascosphaera atra]
MNLFPDDDVLKALMLDGMPDNTTAANAGMSLSHPNLFDDLLAMTSAPVGGEGGKAQPPSTSAFDEGFAGIDDSVLTAILNGSNEGTENAEHAGVEGGEGHGNASADANNGAAQGVSAQ